MSHLAELAAGTKTAINQASDVAALDDVHVEYLGRKGHLTLQIVTLRKLPPEERPAASTAINEAKEQVQQALNVCKTELKSVALNARLAVETIDVSPLGRRIKNGGLHPATRTINRTESFLGELDFTVAAGSKIEDDYHSFNVLNIPGHHPARADRDTFWFDIARLLCAQTFGIQIRTMRTQQPSIRIIAPGRIHRNGYDQAHMLMFHQVEGLIIDTNISFTNLKGTLHGFLHNFFEEDLQVRFRPSHSPSTKPSAEVDVMGESGKRLEVSDCGVAYPNVLRNVGINPEAYSGFTFGAGMGRLIMLCYGVTDLRSLFENDLRFLKQFE